MTNTINLLTRLEASTELERRYADRCAAEVLTGWLASGGAAIQRLRRAAAVLAPTPQHRNPLRSRYPLAVSEGEQ